MKKKTLKGYHAVAAKHGCVIDSVEQRKGGHVKVMITTACGTSLYFTASSTAGKGDSQLLKHLEGFLKRELNALRYA